MPRRLPNQNQIVVDSGPDQNNIFSAPDSDIFE